MKELSTAGQRADSRPAQDVRAVATRSARAAASNPAASNPAATVVDDIDRKILQVLANDARIPNNALAAVVGVAPSTCLSRMRSLVAGGAIRGFHADIDPAALGRPLRMVSVEQDPRAISIIPLKGTFDTYSSDALIGWRRASPHLLGGNLHHSPTKDRR